MSEPTRYNFKSALKASFATGKKMTSPSMGNNFFYVTKAGHIYTSFGSNEMNNMLKIIENGDVYYFVEDANQINSKISDKAKASIRNWTESLLNSPAKENHQIKGIIKSHGVTTNEW